MDVAADVAGPAAKGAGDAAKGAATAAPDIAASVAPDVAGAALGGPLNIVPDAASFAPGAVGDVFGATGASASNILASGGPMAAGLGSSGSFLPGAGGIDSFVQGGGSNLGAGSNDDIISSIMSKMDTGQPLAAGGTTGISSPGAGGDVVSQMTGAPSNLPQGSPGVSAPTAAPGASATSLAPATATAPADATSSWADKLLAGASKSVTNNPLGLALGAGGLAYNIINGQKQSANQAALTDLAGKSVGQSADLANRGVAQVGANQANAADITAKGKDLTSYLTTGKLPDQYTQQIDQAINDAKTTAISNAAKNGQPTDPTKNTALAQSLAQIDNQRAGMTSQIAERLFGAGSGLINTGANIGNVSASSLLSGGQQSANLSADLYKTLTNIDTKQADATSKAIAALAQSLNSGGTQQKQTATV